MTNSEARESEQKREQLEPAERVAIAQVASRLGIVLCRRRRPAKGGSVERPFGTLNRDFFSILPG